MTEHEARQVLLLQAREDGSVSAHWSADDAAWATRQAVAAVGDAAAPATFVVARAAVALQRLLPRDAGARRWLERRAWHAAWVWLAALVGLAAGLLVDQLGPPQHVSLLAPAVWGVVAWNLLVYVGALWSGPGRGSGGLQRALVRLGQRGSGTGAQAALLWARHAAPLSLARAALVLHVAAVTLALGLMAGLYLRGLVLDYRAGWQSTFLDAAQVQAVLGVLLAPASALTGIALPDVAALRVGPGAPAMASAAPWIHLYATTLLLWVVLPRTLLALWAAGRARALARRFPLPLDTPYFERLHPLMRPGMSRTVRLLWVAPPTLAPVTLLGTLLDTADLPPLQPVTLLDGDDGEALQLLPAPPAEALDRSNALVVSTRAWWQRRPAADPAAPSPAALRQQIDAVLWVSRPGLPVPDWLAAMQRPLLVLHDAAIAEPPALPLRNLAAGWLADGRLWQALQAALPGDSRVARLTAVWTARRQAQLGAVSGTLAASLGRVGAARVALADDGLLARRGAADEAQQALATALQTEWQQSAERLAALPGLAPDHAAPAADPQAPADSMANHHALPSAAALRKRVGEGSAAVVGGVTTGALAGLKADLVTGGITMGAGMLVGALLGAVTAAGLARGVNVVRGTDRSFVAWDAQALALLTEAWLLRALAARYPADAARPALQAALAAHKDSWGAVWAGRGQRFDNPGEAQRLADALQAPLDAVLRDALAQLQAAPAAAAPAALPTLALPAAGRPEPGGPEAGPPLRLR